MPIILARRLLLILIISAAAITISPFHPSETHAQDIPRLPACEDEPDEICEVIREWDTDVLATATENLWLEDDTLILFYESADARVVLVAGDFQVALRWIPDTDYFALAVQMPRIREAILTYAFVPITDEGYDQSDLATSVWRGPDGQPAPATNDPIQGTVETHTINSRALNEVRGLTVYLPPDHDPNIQRPVIYLSDGQGVRVFATSIDYLITEGHIPPILLVGMDARVPDQDMAEPRSAEYLIGFDDLRFAAHEQFFIEEVIPFAQNSLGASTDREKRMVFGLSNGAAFSISMGMRHPALFSRIGASSFGWRLDYDVAEDAPPVAYYLSAGTLEPHFHEHTLEWYALLLDQDVDVVYHEIVADHSFANFFTEFTNATLWAFGIGE